MCEKKIDIYEFTENLNSQSIIVILGIIDLILFWFDIISVNLSANICLVLMLLFIIVCVFDKEL